MVPAPRPAGTAPAALRARQGAHCAALPLAGLDRAEVATGPGVVRGGLAVAVACGSLASADGLNALAPRACPGRRRAPAALSPYQESDLLFHLDARAIAAAMTRVVHAPGVAP